MNRSSPQPTAATYLLPKPKKINQPAEKTFYNVPSKVLLKIQSSPTDLWKELPIDNPPNEEDEDDEFNSTESMDEILSGLVAVDLVMNQLKHYFSLVCDEVVIDKEPPPKPANFPNRRGGLDDSSGESADEHSFDEDDNSDIEDGELDLRKRVLDTPPKQTPTETETISTQPAENTSLPYGFSSPREQQQ